MSFSVAYRALAAAALVMLAAACGDTSVNPTGDGHIKLTVRVDPRALPDGEAGIRLSSGSSTMVLTDLYTTFTSLAAVRASTGAEISVLGESRTVRTSLANNTAFHSLTVLAPVAGYNAFRGRVTDVRVVGTYNGTPFDVTYAVNSSFQTSWSHSFRVEPNDTLRVTVPLDPRSWFQSGSALVDPTTGDAALRAAIIARIAASLQAVEDEDEDGLDED